MMLWLHRQGDTLIDGFDFPRMPRIDRSAEGQRRNTFTREEIAAVANTLERYVVEARRDLDGQGNLTKFVVCYYLLASIITGLRTGEQRQLKWSDIRWNEHKDRQGNTFDLVEITVRAETSKVKKSREFFVQDLEYFEALRTVMWPRLPSKKVADYLVFSTNGRSPLTQRAILYHFHQALDDSDIKNRDVRDLVPYSFRHYFITDRIKAGLSHKQVADICGTSITQIENTYRHIDRETRLTAALADYTVDDAGRIIPKQPVDWS